MQGAKILSSGPRRRLTGPSRAIVDWGRLEAGAWCTSFEKKRTELIHRSKLLCIDISLHCTVLGCLFRD